MKFIDRIYEKAKRERQTIVLPEYMDLRTYQAAEAAVRMGIADIIILASPQQAAEYSGGCDLTGIRIIDPKTSEKTEAYEDLFVQLRAHKGMTKEEAHRILQENYTYYGCLMVKAGDADGLVSGACHSTADIMRASLQVIKTAPGSDIVSTCMFLDVPDCEYGFHGLFLYADPVLIQNPTSAELASIAITSAETFRSMVDAEPVVALLSHSTKGSAKHADVDKVREAVRIAQERRPDLMIDGELQLDAAIIPEVGASKAPGSPVAGRANVLVFPDLDAGNIAYKLTQRLAKADMIGPLSQGLAAPANDLSRGGSWEDIVYNIALTAVQIQGLKQKE